MEQFSQANLDIVIDSIIVKFADIFDVPGIAVGVVHNCHPIYSKGYGIANLDTKVPVTSRTLFKVGSVSKIFTATAIMQLVEKGLVSLDDKVYKHVNYFRTRDEDYKLVTVKQLLTHTGGIPDGYKRNYGYQKPEYDDDAIKRFVMSMGNKKLQFLPGENSSYSNNGFVLLSALVEEVTGVRFEDYISENILKPAGVTDGTFDFQSIDRSKLAEGHVIGAGFNNSVNSFFPDTRWITGADGFYGSSDDMNKIASALMDDYRNDSGTILKKNTLEKMWPSGKDAVGLCWNVFDIWGSRLIEHGGNAPGFSAEFAFFNDIAVTVLCNSDRRANREIATAIIKAVANIGETPHSISDGDQILSVMQEKGFGAGIAELERLRNVKGDNFSVFDVMVLSLGILQGTAEKRLVYAKNIIELVIEYYPENGYLNDFLAEVYLRLALKHYGKANALHPNDWGIEKMYNQLKRVDIDFYK